MAEARGLQLGASCCNRPHDCFGPRDIDSSVDVGIATEAASLAFKFGLTLTVRFLAASTLTTGTRRVAGINCMEWNTSKSGLIGEELTQLSKSPTAMPDTLRVSNRAFRTETDVP